MSKYFSAAAVAEILSVPVDKVRDLVANGSITGVNVALNGGGIRPRWRISQEALDQFIAGRQSNQPVATPRKKRETSETTYY